MKMGIPMMPNTATNFRAIWLTAARRSQGTHPLSHNTTNANDAAQASCSCNSRCQSCGSGYTSLDGAGPALAGTAPMHEREEIGGSARKLG